MTESRGARLRRLSRSDSRVRDRRCALGGPQRGTSLTLDYTLHVCIFYISFCFGAGRWSRRGTYYISCHLVGALVENTPDRRILRRREQKKRCNPVFFIHALSLIISTIKGGEKNSSLCTLTLPKSLNIFPHCC